MAVLVVGEGKIKNKREKDRKKHARIYILWNLVCVQPAGLSLCYGGLYFLFSRKNEDSREKGQYQSIRNFTKHNST